MIRSMTGYGAAERVWEEWTIRVEARSVNHSELKLSARMPEMLRLRESELAALAKETIRRGHLYLSVSCELARKALDKTLDRERLRAYLKAVKEVAEGEGVHVSAEVGALMGLPGVINVEALPDDVKDALWEEVVQTVREALKALLAMREAEGRNLCEQLSALCAEVRSRTESVASEAGRCLREYKARLAERVAELMDAAPSPVDQDVIAREVAMIAQRSDVSEEVTRTYSHLDQFEKHLDSDGEPVGRALEFLSQEMLREANTAASKLPSGQQVQQAIRIKADVHRLREQVRNVE